VDTVVAQFFSSTFVDAPTCSASVSSMGFQHTGPQTCRPSSLLRLSSSRTSCLEGVEKEVLWSWDRP
jgi:hypothetical protein